jgi:hypothetical protein
MLTFAACGSTVQGFSSDNTADIAAMTSSLGGNLADAVAYKSFFLSCDEFGVKVPVACWFPPDEQTKSTSDNQHKAKPYKHRISVKRIGQLLAGWNFLPDFVSRDFSLTPSNSRSIIDGNNMELPRSAPVVILAHGYLGSRFDLSHLAEKLSTEGFVCVAAEYPESLAASFDRMEGLTRSVINMILLGALRNDMRFKPTGYAIVGHSLGCGTALDTGDENWARVCLAGFPFRPDGQPIAGNVLFISSMNDGAVSVARKGGKEAIPTDFSILEESQLEKFICNGIPKRSAIVFDGPDAPNHISFLAEGVNDAMIDLLSPLLPVAQSLKIPVLDFDRYKESRDSVQTAAKYHPLVVAYLKQQMQL